MPQLRSQAGFIISLICRMLAQGMELPEETFVHLHNFGSLTETSGALSPVSMSIPLSHNTLHSPHDEVVRIWQWRYNHTPLTCFIGQLSAFG